MMKIANTNRIIVFGAREDGTGRPVLFAASGVCVIGVFKKPAAENRNSLRP
jgi:hypothetical protein